MPGLDNPLAHGQVALGLPGQAGFNVLQDGRKSRGQVAFEKVADKDGLHDHWAGPSSGGPLFGRRPRQERDSVHQIQQAVVVAGDETLRKDGKRKARLSEDSCGALERLAVQSLAIDAEASDAREEEGLQAALHEEVPTRHDVERPADLPAEQRQHHRIARAAVIRGQHHARSGLQ